MIICCCFRCKLINGAANHITHHAVIGYVCNSFGRNMLAVAYNCNAVGNFETFFDEGNKLGISMIAICDTNSDPDLITVPIAGNDDAIRSVELLTKAVADAIIEARREAPLRDDAEEGESYTYSSDRGAEAAYVSQLRNRYPESDETKAIATGACP